MSSPTLLEMLSHMVFSFTRGVTEHYNPDEPEFTPELFGYNAFESTGREWNFFPVATLTLFIECNLNFFLCPIRLQCFKIIGQTK